MFGDLLLQIYLTEGFQKKTIRLRLLKSVDLRDETIFELVMSLTRLSEDTSFCFFFKFSFQHMYAPDPICSVYGRAGSKLSPILAAFVNGVAVSNRHTEQFIT